MSNSGQASDAGSAPLEFIAWAVLLTVPLFPAIELQRAIANQMAAEAIARHALRAAVLQEIAGQPISVEFEPEVQRVAVEIAQSYRVAPEALALSLDCSRCDTHGLVRLGVSISGRRAVGVMGLEPSQP